MENLDLYKCNICGNIVEIVNSAGGEIFCCNQPMEKMIPQTKEDSLEEKHVPIFIKYENDNGEIRIGEILHPMIKEHYIMFAQVFSKDKNFSYLKYFYPEDEPKIFLNNFNHYDFAREYCNIHGLWEGKNT